MSFVYIDSQGREVNIPSVDAVRLRIELGAIKDQTRFFDQNTGKWAPAAEHEIYRTLKRQLLAAEQGFVAPPPSAAIPGATRSAPSPSEVEPKAPTPPDGGGLEKEAPEVDGPRGEADGAQDEPDPDLFAEVDGLPEQSDRGWGDVDEDALDAPASGRAGTAPPEFAGLGDVQLLPTDEESASGDEDESGPDVFDPEDPWADEEASDEGGPSVEDETSAAEEGQEAGLGSEFPESGFVTSVEDELMAGLEADDGATRLEGGSLDLEPSLAESFPGPGETPRDVSAEPETPSSQAEDFDAVWDAAGDHRAESDMSFASTEEPRTKLEEEPAAEVPPRSSGAAPPQRKLTRARTPGAERIVGVVALVVALGAVSFFGWRLIAPALGGGGEPEIVLPPLDQELLPRMRQLAGRASGRMAQDMLELPERAAVPGEPSEDWLAGIYLASASQYPNVPEYWNAIGNWVDAARTAENALFRDALRAQLDTANLAASDAEAIRDRALAGFQAAGSDRRIVYEQMREVSDRALVLHEFLLANEGQVEYEPAGSGVSRDPVLEAVPATEALGDEMWEMVGSITSAMDALGYLNRIDTERLLAVFLEKLDAVAIR